MIRASAASVVQKVVDGNSLSMVLDQELQHYPDHRDQALLQAICYGTCRWYFRLLVVLKPLLLKPLKPKDRIIESIILIGLYQLIEMRMPAYAVVAETVAATVALHKPWAKGLVNAILRQFERQKNQLLAIADQSLVGRYAHPLWLIKKAQLDWPQDWEQILIANNQMPPFALRVNQRIQTREAYLQKVTVAAVPISETSQGIVLEQAVDIQQLPGFAAGEVSVQDGAAQLVGELLELSAKQRVLDACAAPGGKTGHLLELQPDIELVAVDNDEQRLLLARDNLARLNLTAQWLCADVANVTSWWDGSLFDRILLDAPCSASGVVRRHPDIKLVRRATDIQRLAAAQRRLLTAVWQLLKPGGLLVYATCSIFHEENDKILTDFIVDHADAIEKIVPGNWGKACRVGKQILPGMHGMDGFYFGRLIKRYAY